MLRYHVVICFVSSALLLPCSLSTSSTSSPNVNSSTKNIQPSTSAPIPAQIHSYAPRTNSTYIVQPSKSLQPSFSIQHISSTATQTNSPGLNTNAHLAPINSMLNPNISSQMTTSYQLSLMKSFNTMTNLNGISTTSPGFQSSPSTFYTTATTSVVPMSPKTPRPIVITKNIQCINTGGCCTKALSQFPRSLDFEENQTPGTVLVPIFGVEAVTIHLSVVNPPELKGVIEDNFNVSRVGNKFMFQIVKYVDLEDLFLKAGKNERVTNFQLQVLCVDDIPGSVPVPPLTINMTIRDVDDTIPVFLDIPGNDECVVPVYTANTSETFVGELKISPTHIRAVDGDLTQGNNISYSIMHAEPLDYDIFFELNTSDGTVTKTKTMNSSNPTKYVLFVEATEDSPDQQSRVAILSIQIVTSVIVAEDIHKVNPNVKLALEIASVVVIAGFISGFVILICHRRRVKDRKIEVDDEVRDYKIQTIAVYESSCSSLSTNEPDVPTVVSPSTITVAPAKPILSPYAAVRNKRFIRRERSPIDTALRPAWNAPKPKTKPVKYNPYSKTKK